MESRTGGMVLFNLAEQTVKMTLPIGRVLASQIYSERNRSGITPCRNERETCVQGQRDSFLKVPPPGETPPRFQLFFGGQADGSVAGRLPTVTTASTELEAYVVEPGQPTETVKIGFANVPVQNMISQ